VRTPSSCFARLRAAAAVDALALFFATNRSSFAAFAFALSAARSAALLLATRASRKSR
jgi:hypothetical protein